MARNSTYQLMLKICGKADSSLKAACSAAQRDLTTLGNAAKSRGEGSGDCRGCRRRCSCRRRNRRAEIRDGVSGPALQHFHAVGRNGG